MGLFKLGKVCLVFSNHTVIITVRVKDIYPLITL